MLDFISKGIAKLFGTKSDRDVKELLPYVELVNAEYAGLRSLSDDDLRGKSYQIRQTIADRLSAVDAELDSLREQASNPEAELSAKEGLFAAIDKLELERNKQLEVVLLEQLPLAFAVIKETAWRLKENKALKVTLTEHDEYMAELRGHIIIEGNTAIWPNTWTAAGTDIVWDMVHYDVQIIGGVVLHQGKIAEMATGEGKTLVATFPAFLNALAGRGVHIVTVNDYLAKRDSEWMGPLFEFHGMIVDCIDKHEPNSEERRQAYLADITYGTNNEFGFDYLRDNMARSPEELVQRKLHFAMVDEVDSVLVDDARTPLIISGPMSMGDQQLFDVLKPRIYRLVEAQKSLVNRFLVDAKRKLADPNDKEGGVDLFRAHRGLPKNKPLIKFLSETGNKATLQKTENIYLADNSKLMPEADRPLLFTIDEKNNQIDLTEKGIDFITGEGEDPEFFILPDLSIVLSAIENNKNLSEEERLVQKDALINEYSEKTKRIHTVQQLLKAYTLFEKEVEYIIVDGKVKIVDEQTGRIMEGRRYSDGLHQAIEAKENVKIEDATQTYATVTLQNYFRMYHKLCGMTGTAETEAGEFWTIYKLDVVVIPTNRPAVRKDEQDKVYKTVREKFNAVVEEIQALTEAGRPVLVGTTSVEISELLSRMLKMRNIRHNVLNAKYHRQEAEIVAEAGKPSTVTIATNMAGRGTDIKLTPESRASGGLAIIGTERHESRRVDRQLRGRSGRQGDPGTSQFFVSLEDNLMRLFGSDRIIKLMDKMGLQEGEVIQHSMITSSIERAQKKVEENNFSIRKRLLEYDDVMNAQREVIYKRRRNALYGERTELDIMSMIYSASQSIANGTKPTGNYDDFKLQAMHWFGINVQSPTREEFSKQNAGDVSMKLYNEAIHAYRHREESMAENMMPVFTNLKNNAPAEIENIMVPFTDGRKHIQVLVNLEETLDSGAKNVVRTLEQNAVLTYIDSAWKEHLRDMDDLKQSVQNAVFEQKDPLLVYKFEALEMFRGFVGRVNEDVLTFLYKSGIPAEEQQQQQVLRPTQQQQLPREPQPKLQESKPSFYEEEEEQRVAELQDANRIARQQPYRAEHVVNRNDRVSVRYANGELRTGVKYKTVEDDLLNNRCVIVDIA
ncbi:MAG: preprotein translocase subunit SecA [Bacteroidota bacterium]